MPRRPVVVIQSALLVALAVAMLLTGTTLGLVLGVAVGALAFVVLALPDRSTAKTARTWGSRVAVLGLIAFEIFRATQPNDRVRGCVVLSQPAATVLSEATSGRANTAAARGVHDNQVRELLYVAAPLKNAS